MNEFHQSNLKKWLDRFLIFNLLLIFIGFLTFFIGAFLSSIGNNAVYEFFQRLWVPLFIPALSTFFTAVFIEFLLNQISKRTL
tara:strand:- start:1220 stop:1468 length:249 start_codon:yes stop_codon:yes gene_type:complete